jgi:hypothetical protein
VPVAPQGAVTEPSSAIDTATHVGHGSAAVSSVVSGVSSVRSNHQDENHDDEGGRSAVGGDGDHQLRAAPLGPPSLGLPSTSSGSAGTGPRTAAGRGAGADAKESGGGGAAGDHGSGGVLRDCHPE